MNFQNKGLILLITVISHSHAQDATQPSATYNIQANIEARIAQAADGRRTTPWNWSRIQTPTFHNCTQDDITFFREFFEDVKLERASLDINRILSATPVEKLSTQAKDALRQTKQILLELNLD